MDYSLEDVFQATRSKLNDNQVSGGENATDAVLQLYFNEPYRRVFGALPGQSQRIQRSVYVNLPALTGVLIPSLYGITDMFEPTLVEERQATASIAISTSSDASPIIVTFTGPHGLGSTGSTVEGVISGVASTLAPWGRWFGTILSPTTISLNGSKTDGSAGTGGNFTPWSQLPFVPVYSADLPNQGLDGVPQLYLGTCIWSDQRLSFRGSSGARQLRITYWASGNPPTNPNTIIALDGAIDILANGTAANYAESRAFWALSERLNAKTWGPAQEALGNSGLLGEWVRTQVMMMQRRQRRSRPFRPRKTKFGNYPLN